MLKNVKTACNVFFLLLASLSISCVPGIRLDTQGAQHSEVTGKYRVIFYGCNFLNDLETIVLLDKEDDNYLFEPYAPEFKYREKKGMDAATAFAEAENFLQCNASFSRTQLRKIIGHDGGIVGYELRPLYAPFTYGVDDVLDANYVVRGDKVVIFIRLVPSVERMLQGDGGRDIEK
ncbi:MAG: hypothetical protein OEW04_00755 [Nitrospirota bacterium]|nr:hypothetical protein [Nitrospirota bacterium]